MLLTGQYEHSIDAKQRLAIPSELRVRLESEQQCAAFYLGPGPNGALWLWPERTFEQMAAAFDQSLLPGDEMMDYEELLFSQTRRLELDKTGRIRLPEAMIARAGLGAQVMILGVRDHLEIRDPAEWKQQLEDKFDRAGEIMLRARRALRGNGNGSGGG